MIKHVISFVKKSFFLNFQIELMQNSNPGKLAKLLARRVSIFCNISKIISSFSMTRAYAVIHNFIRFLDVYDGTIVPVLTIYQLQLFILDKSISLS